MIAELKRRAAIEHDGDVVAYAVDWQRDGKTLLALANELTVSRALLSTYLNGATPAAREALTHAREEGGHAIIEHARQLAEETATDQGSIAKTRLRTDLDWRIAERWNRRELGESKGATVSISIGQLALEALRQPPPPRPAIATAIAEDAEVLSIEATSTCNAEQSTTDPVSDGDPTG